MKRCRIARPALLMRILTSPKFFTTSSTIAFTAAKSATSALYALALTPFALISETSASASLPELRWLTATFVPSAARLSAISRPTPRAAPVTKAILPFSPKSMIALSVLAARPRRLDQAEQPLWCYGKLINLDPKRRQRVIDRIRDCGRRADRAALTHAAEATQCGRRF